MRDQCLQRWILPVNLNMARLQLKCGLAMLSRECGLADHLLGQAAWRSRDYPLERFLVLNGLKSNRPADPGREVRLIVYRVWATPWNSGTVFSTIESPSPRPSPRRGEGCDPIFPARALRGDARYQLQRGRRG
jgi:hypothetical protein